MERHVVTFNILKTLCIMSLLMNVQTQVIREAAEPVTGGRPLTSRPRCQCAPDQWEGILTSVEREFNMNDGESDMVENSIYVHYDFEHEKFAMTDLSNRKRVVADYTRGTKYIIGDHGCVEIPTDDIMQRMCLPDEAEFVGQFTLGTDIPVGMWQVASVPNITMRTTVLQTNCVPISEEVYMTKGGYSSIINSMYLNISLGIQDASVFIPPRNCAPAAASQLNENEAVNEGVAQLETARNNENILRVDKRSAKTFSQEIRKTMLGL